MVCSSLLKEILIHIFYIYNIDLILTGLSIRCMLIISYSIYILITAPYHYWVHDIMIPSVEQTSLSSEWDNFLTWTGNISDQVRSESALFLVWIYSFCRTSFLFPVNHGINFHFTHFYLPWPGIIWLCSPYLPLLSVTDQGYETYMKRRFIILLLGWVSKEYYSWDSVLKVIGVKLFPVGVCKERATNQSVLWVQFLHQHVWYMLVVLEKRNHLLPRCTKCDMVVTWMTLNGSHQSIEICARVS